MSEVHFAIYFQESTFISRNVLGTSFLISRVDIKTLKMYDYDGLLWPFMGLSSVFEVHLAIRFQESTCISPIVLGTSFYISRVVIEIFEIVGSL